MTLPISRPFWSDGFDVGLPKVMPDAAEIVGDLGDVLLWTSGSADKNGRLNHPSVWNHDLGMVAFFGFMSPAKPEVFYAASGEVRCTFWEAVRDAWVHHFVLLVEQQYVWDTMALWREFETILWHTRGWGDAPPLKRSDAEAALAIDKARRSLVSAVGHFRRLVDKQGDRVEFLAIKRAP